jgi:class 3 adenylate cyclase
MATLEHFHRRATELLKQAAPLPAYDVLAAGLVEFPGDPLLRRLMALALARSGASGPANQMLSALVNEGHHDEETVGMLARTFKDLWSGARGAPQARQHLEHALKWYEEAHRLSGGYWSGINAATMALLLGDNDRASALARHVRDVCLARTAAAAVGADGYWLAATLGEAALILGNQQAAADWYREAVESYQPGVGDRVATRRNARLILKHQRADASAIDACFRIPRVAVFAGHLIDHPERATPRFTGDLQDEVRQAMLDVLRRRDIGVGYASAANGGDILFHECLDALSIDSHVVLPYHRDQFVADSVGFVPGGGWERRFESVIDRATHVLTASQQRMPGNAMSFEYGFLLLDGTAALRAEELDTDLVCIALWDGQRGDGPGGTAESVDHWRRADRDVEIIDLQNIAAGRSKARRVGATAVNQSPRRREYDARIVGLLFADVAGFSRLSEDQIPGFIEHYLGEIGRLVAGHPDPPLLSNTWGDGFYFVFDDVAKTGDFALRLSERLRGIDWTAHNLPAGLGIRVAVHAGPAYAFIDPVTGRPNYLGAHVSLAARIEPVTPPGVVYGSGAFAALAKSAGVSAFSCGYVGPTPLAKGAGTAPVYVIRRRPESE